MDNLENFEELSHLFNFDQPFQTMIDMKEKFIKAITKVLEDKKQAVEQARVINEKAMEQVNTYKQNVIKLIHLLGIAYKERDEANDKLRNLLLVKPYSLYLQPSTTPTTTGLQPKQPPHSTPIPVDHTSLAAPSRQTLNFVSSPISTHSTIQPQPSQSCSNLAYTNIWTAPISTHLSTPQQPPSMNPIVSQDPNVHNFTPSKNPYLQTMYDVGPLSIANDNGFSILPDFGIMNMPSSSCNYSIFDDSFEHGIYNMGGYASSSHDPSTTLYGNLAKERVLPEKGKLLHSVQEAGLLLGPINAGLETTPLPQWRYNQPHEYSQRSHDTSVPISKDKRPRHS